MPRKNTGPCRHVDDRGKSLYEFVVSHKAGLFDVFRCHGCGRGQRRWVRSMNGRRVW